MNARTQGLPAEHCIVLRREDQGFSLHLAVFLMLWLNGVCQSKCGRMSISAQVTPILVLLLSVDLGSTEAHLNCK